MHRVGLRGFHPILPIAGARRQLPLACYTSIKLSNSVRRRFLTQPLSRACSSNMANETKLETIEKDGKRYRAITEGMATILAPPEAKIEEDRGEVQQVFYNPIQQYNRDLSTLAIKTYGEQVVERREKQLAHGKDKQRSVKKRKRDEKDEQGWELPQDDSLAPATEAINTKENNGRRDGAQKDTKVTFTILDALSASGLRALRYAHELPFATSIHANDLSKSAAETIRLNVDYNGVSSKVKVTNDNALAQMYRVVADDLSHRDRRGNPSRSNKWDVIDLDPYGTAAPFFDAAVQAVRDDGGLLCITCTDSAVWAGHSYSEKAFSMYGGTSVKGVFSHEYGLRLILNAVATSAARYGLSIEPQLSLSIDFYSKCFVKVVKSPQAVRFLGAKQMLLYNCDSGCTSWETQYLMRSQAAPNKNKCGVFFKHITAQGPSTNRLCSFCGLKMHLSGPVYGGPIHNPEFVTAMLRQIPKADPKIYQTLTRLEGMLNNVLEEQIPGPPLSTEISLKDAGMAAVDPYPFYHVVNRLAGVLSALSPPDDMFKGALVHLGYRVGRSHCKAGSIKTDAPWSTLWWIMTEWIRQKAPIKPANIKKTSPAWNILYKAGLVGDGEGNEPLKIAESNNATAGRVSSEAEAEAEAEPKPEVEGVTNQSDHNGGTSANDQGVSPSETELRKTLRFDEALASLGKDPKKRAIVRYQLNPRENWGPITKASKN